MAKKEEIQYDKFIDMKKVPILPLDNRWHQLFPDNSKPAKIKKLEKEVMTLVKRESSINHDMKELVALKKKMMKEIVDNMEEAEDENEKLRQKKLATSQKLIGEINDKYRRLENEKYQLPYELIKANQMLLMESIEICYDKLETNRRQIEVLDEWIEKTRIELKKNVIIKQEKQELNNNIYSYMHDILGPEFMEVFDKEHKLSGTS
jgi:CHASE3 domain sensor protein